MVSDDSHINNRYYYTPNIWVLENIKKVFAGGLFSTSSNSTPVCVWVETVLAAVTDRPKHLRGFTLFILKSSWQVGWELCTAQSFRDSGWHRGLHLQCGILIVQVAKERKEEIWGTWEGLGIWEWKDFATEPLCQWGLQPTEHQWMNTGLLLVILGPPLPASLDLEPTANYTYYCWQCN